MGDKQILWACLERLGATDLEDGPDGAVHYRLAGRPGWARWAAGGGLRGWLMIDGLQHVTAEVVINRWLRQQPEPRGCLLEAAPVTTVEDAAWLGAYFERPLDVERISRDDPLQFEVAALAEAWRLRDFGVRADLPTGGEYAPYNPGAIAPANAWLLVGRPEWAFSWLRISDARQAASKGIHELSWHACRDVQAGDLLFFYSQADKAVRYVARAAGDAFETYVERNANCIRSGGSGTPRPSRSCTSACRSCTRSPARSRRGGPGGCSPPPPTGSPSSSGPAARSTSPNSCGCCSPSRSAPERAAELHPHQRVKEPTMPIYTLVYDGSREEPEWDHNPDDQYFDGPGYDENDPFLVAPGAYVCFACQRPITADDRCGC